MEEAVTKKRKKKSLSTRLFNLLIILIFIAGISLLVYPTCADWYNQLGQSRAISRLIEQTNEMDPETIAHLKAEAQKFNAELVNNANRFNMEGELLERYKSLLDPNGTGVMGYVEIDKLNIKLPIYHTSDEAVIQIAAGHLEGSSLPIGGKSTHCVLTSHRGISSARLFTDLDKMEIGDTFKLVVLGDALTYQVDQITTVLPDELDDLAIVEGEDYCTLVTCTPYGINSHRLLVRGTRIPTVEEVKDEPQSVVQDVIDTTKRTIPVYYAVILGIAIVALIYLLVLKKKRRKS